MEVTSGDQTTTADIGAPLLPWTSRPWHVAQQSVLTTCAHMLAAVRSGRDAETSGAENLRTFALVEAAYESAASGRAVAPRRHRG
jgi:predicted dehydrogenase